jgi:hypothetical protein
MSRLTGIGVLLVDNILNWKVAWVPWEENKIREAGFSRMENVERD